MVKAIGRATFAPTRSTAIRTGFAAGVMAGFLTACSGGHSPPIVSDPGVTVAPPPSAAEQAERAQVSAALAEVTTIDRAGLLSRYPAGFTTTLGYDPSAAANLPLIQSSQLALNAAENQILTQNGFVISDRLRYPGFVYGYDTIYSQDLPLFVSADSILNAVHRSYDDLLKGLEVGSLADLLSALLQGMRSNLAGGAIAALGPDVARDIDLYLAVPLGLLQGSAPAPVAGASASDIASFIAKAQAATGIATISLFGSARDEDFSQFTPRGHYTDSDALKQYFRAMIWLGRFDQRMLETQPDGTQVFHRRQFDGALGLTTLLDADNQARWQAITAALDAFVGEPDSMQPPEFPALLAQLHAPDLAAVEALDDATIADALVAGHFGAQRIASAVMITGVHDQALPLSRSFLLLGQRYVVDSHVFSNVVYDRVPPTTAGRMRMLPNPLDVAFAVFGDNQAGAMMQAELDTFAYAPALASMRVLVDAHGADFWGKNLYNLWLGSLRALSPVAGGQSGPFAVASTEPWGRRLLNAQLASWAELRHDTILYVKQSYSTGVTCAFPDALVEPNPAFFGKLVDFAAKGKQVIVALAPPSGIATAANAFFDNLTSAAGTLKAMAEAQVAGTPFTDDQMAFINQTVKVQTICGGATAMGWYPKLFYGYNSTDFHPTIADVHTAPTDEAGDPVGNVLHVGTGYARLMVVTANTCTGPKAYVGLASSYFEDTTTNLKRLDDPSWKALLDGTTRPADVSWMTDLISR
jgi:hypothetical protein